MGQHSSARAATGRFGWRRIVIGAITVGAVSATVAGVGLASGTPTSSVYSAITPVTVLGKSLAADSNTDVVVAGVGSVPSNATSVQLSVTALGGTTTSSMYVYATGTTKPTSANVRWASGQTITIPVTVAVGTAGKIRLTTDGGTVTIKVAVVGYFSPAPAPGSTGYAATADGVSIVNFFSGGTNVVSVTVPPGTYEVQAKATMELNNGEPDGTEDNISCYLEDPTSTLFDHTDLNVSTSDQFGPTSLMGFDTTTSGGAMTLYCSDIGSASSADDVQLGAIRLSSATGAVSGS
jgi:hypothetical protein